MSSVTGTGPRQVGANGGYYMPLSTLQGLIQSYNPDTGALSVALWASTGGVGCSTINAPFKSLLRDQGKTVVSSGRTFRKIQVVGNTANNYTGSPSTFGVLGPADTTAGPGYLTGYIELGVGDDVRAGPVPVALFGR